MHNRSWLNYSPMCYNPGSIQMRGLHTHIHTPLPPKNVKVPVKLPAPFWYLNIHPAVESSRMCAWIP